ncbi:hypothetical protein [Vibrio kasasachensis]|uniref:hypothetical protein n=1 Tax=Vibrio kasasachensis TaxID=2910248 RepID=UPI003D0DA49E
MKHFLPSSIMLTPFLVKYYRNQEEYCPDTSTEQQDSSSLTENISQDNDPNLLSRKDSKANKRTKS